MKIEIIIPNYNGSDLVSLNLEKVLLACSDYKDLEITIVDDGSTKADQESLKKIIPSIQKKYKSKINLELNDKNVGFSSNVNRAGLKSSAEILVLLNTDVEPQKDFLKPLLEHFDNPLVFGVACMDKSIEDDKVVLRGRGLAKWHKGFLAHRRGEVDQHNTFWISGGSSAVRAEIYKKLGGFDPLYNPFYWEDIDLSYRAQKAGYKIIFESKSVVVHRHSKGSIKKHYNDSVIKSYAMRNQFTFIWKNMTDFELLASHMVYLPYYLLRALMSGDRIFLIGFYLAILRLPDIMKHRKTQKKMYIISDKQVLSNYL